MGQWPDSTNRQFFANLDLQTPQCDPTAVEGGTDDLRVSA